MTYKTPKYTTPNVKLSAYSSIPIASCTKIVSLLVVINCVDSGLIKFDDLVLVETYMLASGSSAHLRPGDKLTINELM